MQLRMIRVYESKLYPTAEQETVLDSWLRVCQCLYNRALEHRIKAWKRRKQHIGYADQTKLLTKLREVKPHLRLVPVHFERSAIVRVDEGFSHFFRRVKARDTKPGKAGFPRFKPIQRYRSMTYLAAGDYLVGDDVRVPKLGLVRCRDSRQHSEKLTAAGKPTREIVGKQKSLRLVKRATGWYAQVITEDGKEPPKPVEITDASPAVGIDVGLESFATLSDGTPIENPRWLAKASRDLRRAHRSVSRKQKGSRNRRKAVTRLARKYERLGNRRRAFAHLHSKKLVEQYDLIAVEDLNIAGMSRGRLAKPILDAAWGLFLGYLAYKAERAGKQVVKVDPRGTSQQCSHCGAKEPKELSQRMHECPACGLRIHRDHNAALNILARGRRATACRGDVRPPPDSRKRRPRRRRKEPPK